MNKQPVSYLQTDPRWKNTPYQVEGKETTTIGASGCGPTCAAMLIETLCGFKYTPADACAWSVNHGYKAVNQGTYYSYFKPQFGVFDIPCEQLNTASIYGGANGAANIHRKAFAMLQEGYYLIACMGPGTWTKGGHYVVVWWEDGKVRINDPASTKDARLNGDLQTFQSQVKYYWAVDAREFNNPTKEDDDMDVTRFKELWQEMRKDLQDNDAGAWSQEARDWAVNSGLVQGGSAGEFNGMWEDLLTREQLVTVLYRFAKLLGKA